MFVTQLYVIVLQMKLIVRRGRGRHATTQSTIACYTITYSLSLGRICHFKYLSFSIIPFVRNTVVSNCAAIGIDREDMKLRYLPLCVMPLGH